MVRVNAVSVLLFALCILASGCSSHYVAPVESDTTEASTAPAPVSRLPAPRGPAPEAYRIVSGDTLYSIAWRYGLDYKELARWNGISPPYTIYVGQRLRLEAPPNASAPSGARVARQPAAAPAPSSATPSREVVVRLPPANNVEPSSLDKPEPVRPANSKIRWQWPARGKITNADFVIGQRGINILGSRRQPIVAAAPGQVVYSGSGLVGYGKLIIIKHDDTFLSAYAHNETILVREGARVVGGQQIAEMGSTGTKQIMLHFEIRRNGKPVPPMQYLP